MEDRHGSRSALITSQLAVMDWHSEIGAATPADAILYRLTHNSHRIVLKDTSMLAIVAHGERPKSVKLFTSGDIAAFAHSLCAAITLGQNI